MKKETKYKEPLDNGIVEDELVAYQRSLFDDAFVNEIPSTKTNTQILSQSHINLATSFSGIGAVETALKQLNISHDIIFAGDIDYYCKLTYFANYDISEDKWHNDIRNFSAKKYKGLVDLYVGGSPCQSFSIMGKRKGLEEARGTLFYEYARLIAESKPKVFIFENVVGILNHDKGKTWQIISEIFDDLGYLWKSWILNAKNYGLPQNRRRVFVVGFDKKYKTFFEKLSKPIPIKLEIEVQNLLESNVPNKYYLPQKGFMRVTSPKEGKHIALNSKISRCQVACQQYNWFGDMRFEQNFPERIEVDDRIYKGEYNGVRGVTRMLTPRECLRLMGFPDTFKIVVNDTQMYRESGNSIAVNVIMKVVDSIFKTGIFDNE